MNALNFGIDNFWTFQLKAVLYLKLNFEIQIWLNREGKVVGNLSWKRK